MQFSTAIGVATPLNTPQPMYLGGNTDTTEVVFQQAYPNLFRLGIFSLLNNSGLPITGGTAKSALETWDASSASWSEAYAVAFDNTKAQETVNLGHLAIEGGDKIRCRITLLSGALAINTFGAVTLI